MESIQAVYPAVPTYGATNNASIVYTPTQNSFFSPTFLNAGIPTKATTTPAIGIAQSDQRPMPTRNIGEPRMYAPKTISTVMVPGYETSPTTPIAYPTNMAPFYITVVNPGASAATAIPQQQHAFSMPRNLPPIKTTLSPTHRGAPSPLASPHRPITPTAGEPTLPRRHIRAVRKTASADDQILSADDSPLQSQRYGVVVTGEQTGPGISWRAALAQTEQQQQAQIAQLAQQQAQLLQQIQQAQAQQQQMVVLAQQAQQAEDGSGAMQAAIQMMAAAAGMQQPATGPTPAIPSANSGTCALPAASLQQQDGCAAQQQQQQQAQLHSSGSFHSATGSNKGVAAAATCVHLPAAAPTAGWSDKEQEELKLLAMLWQQKEAVELRHQQELAAAAAAVQQAQQALQALQQQAQQQVAGAGCEASTSAVPALDEEDDDEDWLWSVLNEEGVPQLQQSVQLQPAAAAGLWEDSWMWDLVMQEEEGTVAAAGGSGVRGAAAGLKRGRQSSWDEALLQELYGGDIDDDDEGSGAARGRR